MSAIAALQADDADLLLAGLKRLGPDVRVLLLGPGQAMKPGAEALLAAEAGKDGVCWVPAHPHPDLTLDAYGRWLAAEGRPPFGPGRMRHASAWGMLGAAGGFAAALELGLAQKPADGDWQPAFLARLFDGAAGPRVLKQAWIFQQELPSLSAALGLETRRALTWSRLKSLDAALSDVSAPAPAFDIPSEWSKVAESLAAVPLGPLQSVKISGISSTELLGGLAKASMDRAFELAFAQGWNSAPAPEAASVARKLSRVAVVHPAYGGSLNLAQRSAEALERLGYEVVRVEPGKKLQGAMTDALRRGDAALMQSLEKECLTAIAGSRAQWLWILAYAPLSANALRSLRRQGLFTAFWFCEDHRVRPVWREWAACVDAFFPLQGGPFKAALQAAGVPVFEPLINAAASDACRAPMPAAFRHQLTFFGAPYLNRVRLFELFADLPLELYGEGWREQASSLLQPLVKDGSRLNEAQGFELFRGSAVSLNLHSSPFHLGIDPEGDYVNPRAFEIAACGGFQLCDRRKDLPSAFDEGMEIEAFSSAVELREKTARWLADPAGRRRIAEAGRRRVLAGHTYEHRMAQVVKALGLEIPRLS